MNSSDFTPASDLTQMKARPPHPLVLKLRHPRSLVRRRGGFISLAALGATILAGCAVGPRYQPPRTETATAFADHSTNYVATEIDPRWWQSFNDATLTRLIERSLATNQDLRIAMANLRSARALRAQSRLDFFPTVTANASYANTLLSRTAVFGIPGINRQEELYDAGFDATWELDFFGRVRRSVQARDAEVEAAEAARRDTQVSLLGEVGRNYFELLGTQNELAVAHRNAENQRQTLQITTSRLEGGRGTELDVARARAQLNNTLATIPPMESAIAHAIHRLSVLEGQPPSALTDELSPAAPLPILPAVVAIGEPAALLRRRPDIRFAERNLAAATARVGVAVADLFPRVTFVGAVGLEAASFAGLGRDGADTRSFGPRISWAALDLGRVRARIKAADAQVEAQLALYEKTVLTALEETENALVDFGRERTRGEFLRESVTASETAANLARQRYENGATDFLNVLDSERVLLEAQDQLAQSQTRAATALVAVYKSLGGGWQTDAPSGSKP